MVDAPEKIMTNEGGDSVRKSGATRAIALKERI